MRQQSVVVLLLPRQVGKTNLVQDIAEALAGRVSYHELTPFILGEVGQDHLLWPWLRNGFPDSFPVGVDQDCLTWCNDFVRAYLERGIPSLGLRFPAETQPGFRSDLRDLICGLMGRAAGWTHAPGGTSGTVMTSNLRLYGMVVQDGAVGLVPC